ncbi:MAG: hypothetical protein ACQKBY_11580 [Verrucomicrobiales bacterium]
MDLNANNAETPPGGTWNEFAAPSDINGSTIVDSTNAASVVTLNKSGTMTDHGSSGAVIYDPTTPSENPAWATAVGANGAAGDYFYTANASTGSDSYTLTYGNLLAGSAVSLDLLASRDSNSALGFYDYSLDGGITWSGFNVYNPNGTLATGKWDGVDTLGEVFLMNGDGHDNHLYMSMSGTLGAGVTDLMVRVTDGNTNQGTFSGMNALRLTATPAPEPSVFSALVLGLGLMCRRKRSAKI